MRHVLSPCGSSWIEGVQGKTIKEISVPKKEELTGGYKVLSRALQFVVITKYHLGDRKTIRWTGPVICTGHQNRLFGRPTCREADNIKVNLK